MDNKAKKKNIIIAVFILVIAASIFLWYHNNNLASDENDIKNVDTVSKEVDMTQEEIAVIVEQCIVDNQEEINALGDDTRKISKLLYSEVMRKCKGQARASDVKVAIELVLAKRNVQ